jgi:hypothetical protein
VKAFIVSHNIKRRHLNSGQRAMAVAVMYPQPADTSKNAMKDKTGSVTEPVLDVSPGRLSMARTVLRALPTIAEKVMAVAMMLPVGAAFFSLPHRTARTS